ncbi:MAG: type II toxin-antitoxin system VapC family toxin [Sphingorhabdus sp.]
MRLLIDTHVFIWWQNDDPLLSKAARAVLADPQHSLLVSIASFWEMSIKFRQGKLQSAGSVAYRKAIGEQVSILDVKLDHLAALEALPDRPDHKDPFDRMMLAQALSEGCPLMTGDRKMVGYGVSCIGVR